MKKMFKNLVKEKGLSYKLTQNKSGLRRAISITSSLLNGTPKKEGKY